MLAATGCSLIDQKTFAPSPSAKAQPAPAAPPPPAPVPADARRPLVTIEYTGADPDFAELLHYAVRAAENRNGDVQYDVIAVVPDDAGAMQGSERAVRVMTAIMRDRVAASRIHLAVRTDPLLATGQVRVYVR
jgi:hypothetical protein